MVGLPFIDEGKRNSKREKGGCLLTQT